MTRIELTDQQAEALREELGRLVSELGMEIAATERLDFRDQVKARRRLLAEVLDALRERTSHAA